MFTNANNQSQAPANHLAALRNRLARAAAAINPADQSTVEFDGKAYPLAVVNAAALSAGLIAGYLFVQGSEMLNPCVTIAGRRAGRSAAMHLTFNKRINAQGDLQSASIKVTPTLLAEMMQGFIRTQGGALALEDHAQIAAKLAASHPLRTAGGKAPNGPRHRPVMSRLSAGQRPAVIA